MEQRVAARLQGGCGSQNGCVLSATSLPPLYALTLQWDSPSINILDIGTVTCMLPTLLDLGQVYRSEPR